MLKIFSSMFSSIVRYVKGIYAIRLVKNWPIVFVHLANPANVPSKLIEYQLVNGLKLSTYATKRNRTILLSLYEVLLRKIYPIDTLDLQVVLDLGAQIGVFSLFVAHTKRARVYAFEPEPENFRTLQANIKNNDFQFHIFPQQVCIAATRGTTEFFINASSSRSNGRFINMRSPSIKAIKVETFSLNDIFSNLPEKKIDLMKVDIEGSEYEVFYSSPPHLFEKIQRIYVECHEVYDSPPTHTLEYMRSFLEQLEYEVVVGRDESILYASRVNQ